MTIEFSEPLAMSAFSGGLLIGISAVLLLFFNGRVAGISGIARRLLSLKRGDISWRVAFILGLSCGGFFLSHLYPEKFSLGPTNPIWRMPLAGLLVGIGTSLSGGCTSGHGVCGVARLSRRSIVATLTFMATGFIAVYLFRTIGGIL
jgi:uncharacterized membrane protein YedE/YeeE